ncbi:flagellar protein FlgN [Christensenellaceae bacterium OttesenSCG-928-K19]|nr:flagellar protein FlgN [Christensenellaceae bacterium OttesenSCG-928-K19]
MIGKVVDLLRQIEGVYKELYALSEKKQERIVANDAEAVSEIVKEEWRILTEAEELETKRGEAVREYLEQKGDAAGSTLQDVLAVASPEEREKLEVVSGELRELLEKQKKINAENRSLIELHLEYLDYMVNTVLKEPQVSDIYGNSGMVADVSTANKGIIDNEA